MKSPLLPYSYRVTILFGKNLLVRVDWSSDSSGSWLAATVATFCHGEHQIQVNGRVLPSRILTLNVQCVCKLYVVMANLSGSGHSVWRGAHQPEGDRGSPRHGTPLLDRLGSGHPQAHGVFQTGLSCDRITKHFSYKFFRCKSTFIIQILIL